MRPTFAADELRRNLTDYLTTTFALSDEATRTALATFLNDPIHGIFRGPYLRVRTPFRLADPTWRKHLDWAPSAFTPYRHQARAFERLSTLHSPAQPTIITTGTGSGKTEAFLYPILDHCQRERAAGHSGVKAVLLYPMNALATDQAGRLNDLLTDDPTLKDVTAGLYIGDTPAAGYARVMTDRREIRQAHPDILITNYKMLDLLLQREDDVPLWEGAALAYVVVDEFHTYDGAQGTDVAMLLRRLAVVVGQDRPGHPLGGICPVATSATLGQSSSAGAGAGGGSGTGSQALLRVASQVFGTEFPRGAVIGEDRLSGREFVSKLNYKLPLPAPELLCALPDPARDGNAFRMLASTVTGKANLSPTQLGAVLREHILTAALLEALGEGSAGAVAGPIEILEALARLGAYHWGETVHERPEMAVEALSRFVALVSMARDPDDPEGKRPFLHVEGHLWVRGITRLQRAVSSTPKFAWSDREPRSAASELDTAPERGLPAVSCRHCGRAGWAVYSPESTPEELDTRAEKIYLASTGSEKSRVRPLIQATAAEAEARQGRGRHAHGDGGAAVMVLDEDGTRLRPLDRERDLTEGGKTREGAVLVWASVATDQTSEGRADRDWCPACATDHGILFLGARIAQLAAVAVTQLFTGGELDEPIGTIGIPETTGQTGRAAGRAEVARPGRGRKALIFSDSVQDTAHRAGYVASRSYTFSLRALLADQLRDGNAAQLNDLISGLVKDATDPEVLAAVVPPDIHDRADVHALLSGEDKGSRETWELIGQRLAFATVMEFGLRSRQGRTLELTRTAAAEVIIDDPDRVAAVARDVLIRMPRMKLEGTGDPDPGQYLAFVRGLLERLRMRGGVHHDWLVGYWRQSGTRRWPIWGGRPSGMPAFPRGVSAPVFLLGQPRKDSALDVAGRRTGWYQEWASRCLAIDDRDTAGEYVTRLLPELVELGLLSADEAEDGGAVYGLRPGHIRVRLLEDGEVTAAGLVCDVCAWELTVLPERAAGWDGQPCTRYRCPGTLRAPGRPAPHQGGAPGNGAGGPGGRDFRDDYYRRLYRTSGPFRVVTAEHTSQLSRAAREEVEAAFRRGDGYSDPNVLACTPTLELGIDIGDLSAVVLASVPPGPAKYVQRAGRAGRRTGNALVLTLVDRTPRDLYYLADPLEMIAGEITPPGCHLSAVEILRRQYLAHLVDLAARGQLVEEPEDGAPGAERPGADGAGAGEFGLVRPLPYWASRLFGESGWLASLVAAAERDGAALVERFLGLFPEEVGRDAGAALRAFATGGGLREAVAAAEGVWEGRLDDLRDRLRAIEDTTSGLMDSDPEQATERRQLGAERRAVQNRIGDINRAPAHSTLVELGLLPNYSLLDTTTALEATLMWQEPGADGKPEFRSELREYARPSRLALTELAPGNSFYVNGYRHTVSGLEVGSAARPAWQTWRICPECGYVRTADAAGDPSPCPRCGSHAIGDQGCLHQVLVPRRVTARDKRDDARIRDDSEDRDRRGYTIAHAVDIPPDAIESAWRHQTATFGVDFTRRAVVRTFNLGERRADRPATDQFAGETVRLDPFTACTACGGATAGGAPDEDGRDTLGLTVTGARGQTTSRHRPWCPRHPRRQGARPPVSEGGATAAHDVRLLLVHELRTEALRILLPIATTDAPERLTSFLSALRAGIAARYGGHPDHLDAVTATMPDQAPDATRRFVVLYDTLPGGTGYLHRLADPEEFREVLTAARTLTAQCRCAGEGLDACHRCLLGYVRTDQYPLVRRDEALRILTELLGTEYTTGSEQPVAGPPGTGRPAAGLAVAEPAAAGPPDAGVRDPATDAGAPLGVGTIPDGWAVDDQINSTDDIRLTNQVESELEDRFVHGLLEWAKAPGTPGTANRNTGASGKQHIDLRVTAPDGETVTHWDVTLQKDLRDTRPDVLFTRLDGPPLEVAVYLDGYRWHASPEANRIAADARKRTQLRGKGMPVFQLTWQDVTSWAGRYGVGDPLNAGRPARPRNGQPAPPGPVWPPYQNLAQGTARTHYTDNTGRAAQELPDTVWTNPAETLVAFLGDPDLERWRQRAEAALMGLVNKPGREVTAIDPAQLGPDGVGRQVAVALRGEPLPAQVESDQRIGLARATDDNGLPLVMLLRERSGALTFSAVALLDDDPATVAADESTHRRRWAAWLWWGNLIQFLTPRDSGLQVARSTLDTLDLTEFVAGVLPVPIPASAPVPAPPAGREAAVSPPSRDRTTADEQAEALPEGLPEAAEVGESGAKVRAGVGDAAGVAEAGVEAREAASISPDWLAIIELLDSSETGLKDLGRHLATMRVPLPECGYELGEAAWLAELAWPDQKIAVVLASRPDQDEDERRDAAYRADGWEVRPATGWTAEELRGRVAGPDTTSGAKSQTESDTTTERGR